MSVYNRLSSLALLNPTDSAVVDAELTPTAYTWGADDSRAPWITATVTIPPPSLALWALLDPAVRPIVLCNENVDGLDNWNKATSFGLRVYSRVRNTDNSVTLTLVSAEQDLIDWTPLYPNVTAKARQASVQSIVDGLLSTVYGTALRYDMIPVAGAANQQLAGPFYTYEPATNLVANGSFETGTTGWSATRGTIRTQAWSGGLGPNMGTTTLRVEGSGTSNDTFAWTPVNLQPNTTYTMSGWVLNGAPMSSSADFRARSLCIVATVNGSAFILAQTNQGANTANGITRVTGTFTTPAMMDPTGATLRAYNGTTTGSSNPVLWDGIMIVEGNGLDTDGSAIPYFDGGTVDGTGKGAGYNYDWQGDAGNSSSTRTPVLDRASDTLVWKPGTSAWDFLQPILQALGGRIYSPVGYESWPGRPAVASFQLVTSNFQPADIASRFVEGSTLYSVEATNDLGGEFPDGTPMFADKVIIHYTWTDSLGREREAYDTAGAAGYFKPWVLELQEPFPGAGRAQGLYQRLSARRSALTVTGPYNPGLRPGTQVSITSSQIDGNALAIIDAADHDPYNGVSTIRTKAAVGYPSDAWITKGTAWSAVTTTWANWAS